MTHISGRPPTVSVILPVYNAAQFLPSALESVLQQTYRDFELLVIDDGSTDESGNVINGYSAKDRRIRALRHSNVGITETLNRGLLESRGRWIARMDADDISDPARLERQIEHVAKNLQTKVLGTRFTGIDSQGAPLRDYSPPCQPWLIEWEMCRRCAIGHPTVVMEREFILKVGGYNRQLRYAQDYDLWLRVIRSGGQVANLHERLLRYRESPTSATIARRKEQDFFALSAAAEHVAWLLGRPVAPMAVGSLKRLIGNPVLDCDFSFHAGMSLIAQVNRVFGQRLSSRQFDAVRRMTADALLDYLTQDDNGQHRRTRVLSVVQVILVLPHTILDGRMRRLLLSCGRLR